MEEYAITITGKMKFAPEELESYTLEEWFEQWLIEEIADATDGEMYDLEVKWEKTRVTL